MINLSFDKLRLIAQIRNISGYENKSKDDLIKALSEPKPEKPKPKSETLKRKPETPKPKLETPKPKPKKPETRKKSKLETKPKPEARKIRVKTDKRKLRRLRKDFD